jgi:hypothetical protein
MNSQRSKTGATEPLPDPFAYTAPPGPAAVFRSNTQCRIVGYPVPSFAMMYMAAPEFPASPKFTLKLSATAFRKIKPSISVPVSGYARYNKLYELSVLSPGTPMSPLRIVGFAWGLFLPEKIHFRKNRRTAEPRTAAESGHSGLRFQRENTFPVPPRSRPRYRMLTAHRADSGMRHSNSDRCSDPMTASQHNSAYSDYDIQQYKGKIESLS